MKHTPNAPSSNSTEEATSDNSSKQLIEKIEIEDTPFTAVKYIDRWYLCMGRYRLTEGLDTETHVREQAYDTSWHRIMQVMQIMIDEDKKQTAPDNRVNSEENIIRNLKQQQQSQHTKGSDLID